MVKLTVAVATLFALSVAGTRARAQSESTPSIEPTVATTSLQTASAVASPEPTGPTLQSSALSPRLADEAALDANAMRTPSRGSGVGLMILGGAALITGAIIGGSPGTIIAVGGAVVGLYGLYVYLDRPHGMEQRSGIGLGYSLKTN